MDLDQLKQILDLVREHELSEFEIEQDGLRLKIRKDKSGGFVPMDFNPEPDTPILAGDKLVVLGRPHSLRRLEVEATE